MIDFSAVKEMTIPEGSVSRIFVGGNVLWKKNTLPTGYTVQEYIESANEQYIDTEVLPNSNSRVVMDFALTSTGSNRVFGGRTNTSNCAFTLNTSSGKWRFGYYSTIDTGIACDTKRHIADLNKNVLSLDGNVIGTAEEREFECAYSICLGAIKGSSQMYLGKVKIYSCQIYDHGVLVRDYVPCINANREAGMYDRVNNVFYGNAGTGTFVTGE